MKANISLVGFRCTGKSTVAALLAQRLGFEHVNADQSIVDRAGKSISAIFEEDGEEAFRAIEADITAESCRRSGIILDTGGGALMNPQSFENVTSNCFVVLLEADIDTIIERMKEDPATSTNRPSLTDLDMRREVEHLLSIRNDTYRAAGDIVIDTTSNAYAAIVDEIVAAFENRGS